MSRTRFAALAAASLLSLAACADATAPRNEKTEVQKPEVQKPEHEKIEVQKPEVQKPEVQKPEVQKVEDPR